jgi:hypothetical protein
MSGLIKMVCCFMARSGTPYKEGGYSKIMVKYILPNPNFCL